MATANIDKNVNKNIDRKSPEISDSAMQNQSNRTANKLSPAQFAKFNNEQGNSKKTMEMVNRDEALNELRKSGIVKNVKTMLESKLNNRNISDSAMQNQYPSRYEEELNNGTWDKAISRVSDANNYSNYNQMNNPFSSNYTNPYGQSTAANAQNTPQWNQSFSTFPNNNNAYGQQYPNNLQNFMNNEAAMLNAVKERMIWGGTQQPFMTPGVNDNVDNASIEWCKERMNRGATQSGGLDYVSVESEFASRAEQCNLRVLKSPSDGAIYINDIAIEPNTFFLVSTAYDENGKQKAMKVIGSFVNGKGLVNDDKYSDLYLQIDEIFGDIAQRPLQFVGSQGNEIDLKFATYHRKKDIDGRILSNSEFTVAFSNVVQKNPDSGENELLALPTLQVMAANALPGILNYEQSHPALKTFSQYLNIEALVNDASMADSLLQEGSARMLEMLENTRRKIAEKQEQINVQQMNVNNKKLAMNAVSGIRPRDARRINERGNAQLQIEVQNGEREIERIKRDTDKLQYEYNQQLTQINAINSSQGQQNKKLNYDRAIADAINCSEASMIGNGFNKRNEPLGSIDLEVFAKTYFDRNPGTSSVEVAAVMQNMRDINNMYKNNDINAVFNNLRYMQQSMKVNAHAGRLASTLILALDTLPKMCKLMGVGTKNKNIASDTNSFEELKNLNTGIVTILKGEGVPEFMIPAYLMADTRTQYPNGDREKYNRIMHNKDGYHAYALNTDRNKGISLDAKQKSENSIIEDMKKFSADNNIAVNRNPAQFQQFNPQAYGNQAPPQFNTQSYNPPPQPPQFNPQAYGNQTPSPYNAQSYNPPAPPTQPYNPQAYGNQTPSPYNAQSYNPPAPPPSAAPAQSYNNSQGYDAPPSPYNAQSYDNIVEPPAPPPSAAPAQSYNNSQGYDNQGPADRPYSSTQQNFNNQNQRPSTTESVRRQNADELKDLLNDNGFKRDFIDPMQKLAPHFLSDLMNSAKNGNSLLNLSESDQRGDPSLQFDKLKDALAKPLTDSLKRHLTGKDYFAGEKIDIDQIVKNALTPERGTKILSVDVPNSSTTSLLNIRDMLKPSLQALSKTADLLNTLKPIQLRKEEFSDLCNDVVADLREAADGNDINDIQELNDNLGNYVKSMPKELATKRAAPPTQEELDDSRSMAESMPISTGNAAEDFANKRKWRAENSPKIDGKNNARNSLAALTQMARNLFNNIGVKNDKEKANIQSAPPRPQSVEGTWQDRVGRPSSTRSSSASSNRGM